MEHLTSKRGPTINSQFDEFKIMFKDLRKDKHKLTYEDDVFPISSINLMGAPSTEELDTKQKIIDDLIKKRYVDQDNAFLRITEMDSFEKFSVYKDEYILFNLRMKIWNFYM